MEAYETKAKIKEQLKLMEFASLPAIMKTAQDLVKKIDSMTNFELANIISKDPFAIAKVLDLANRRGGSEKLSVVKLEDAVLTVGYDKVRAIARQLLDMENMKERLRHPEQQDAAGISVCACILAENIAQKGTKLDSNEAYTAAVLRGYGRVLLSAFLVEDYRKALALEKLRGNTDAAFREVFGIAPIELTYDLLAESKVPKTYLKTLRRVKPEFLEPEGVSEAEEYICVAEFSVRVMEMMYDLRLRCAKFEEQLAEFLAQYAHRVHLTIEQLFEIIKTLDETILAMGDRYDIDPLPPGMYDIINARAEHAEPPPPVQRGPARSARGGEDPALKKKPEEILLEGIPEIGRVSTKRTANWEEILTMTQRIVKDGLELEDLVFFMKGEKDDSPIEMRYGPGELYKLAKRMNLKIKGVGDDIVALCLANKCDALIFDTAKPNIKERIPGWLEGMKANSVVVVPFHDPKGEPFALMLGYRTNGTSIQLGAKAQQAIMAIRRFFVGVHTENKPKVEEVLEKPQFMDLKVFNKLASVPVVKVSRKAFQKEE